MPKMFQWKAFLPVAGDWDWMIFKIPSKQAFHDFCVLSMANIFLLILKQKCYQMQQIFYVLTLSALKFFWITLQLFPCHKLLFLQVLPGTGCSGSSEERGKKKTKKREKILKKRNQKAALMCYVLKCSDDVLPFQDMAQHPADSQAGRRFQGEPLPSSEPPLRAAFMQPG